MAAASKNNIRNTGIIAHIDAGKTTLSERILFYSQKIHKMGEVHDGAATMDFMPEEQERGITINAACTSCQWNDCQINLVDTPGHMDFTMEVERSLRVLDSAIGVFCAVGGVEPQSETVWRQADEFDLPRIAFINKIDRTGANFERVLKEIKDKLNANTLPLVLPSGEGDQFSGLINLLEGKKLVFYEKDQGKTIIYHDLNQEEHKYANTWLDKTLETLAENDDEFLDLWLNGNYSKEDILKAIKRATLSRKAIPVYCGSALRNCGVQPLLDGLCTFLPSPFEARPAIAFKKNGEKIEISPDKIKSPLALAFKIELGEGRKNCFFRLYSGSLKESDQLLNMRTGKYERINRMYRIHADRREQVSQISAGDIGLIVGFRDVQTGDSLVSPDLSCFLEPVQDNPVVISYSLEPANAEEAKILDEALARYVQEDPALAWQIDEENGLRILSGLGELHIEVTLERLEREYKIHPRKGQPKAAMRETIQSRGNARILFDREFGKERQVGEVEVEVEALPRNSENEIFFPENEENRQESKKNQLLWQTAVRDGISSVLQSGPLAGWPIQDVRVTVKDVARQENLTTLAGLEMAASQACREALMNAKPVLLEPIMKIEIIIPEDFLGPSLQLIQQNGGKINSIEDKGSIKKIEAYAPMRQLFGFATRLRSSTQGRAGLSMSFHSYDISN